MHPNQATVVGAGIAGVMTALSLARRGVAVTLIDRWEPGHARASSTDYNRVYRCIHGNDELYTRWARLARQQWLELQAEAATRLYYECGALILATKNHCHWEDATTATFQKLGVPFHKFSPEETAARFPQFDTKSISYALYEPEAGMIMAHRAVLAGLELFKRAGGTVKRGTVTTDRAEVLHLDGKPLGDGLTIVATGSWMSEMFPRTIRPITKVVGINVVYTSTPEGSTLFDHDAMPCWIDHGEGSFGLPSVEGHGVKAAVVIPDTIDLDNDERLIKPAIVARTRRYIKKRLPGLVGQKVVDSKFNQIILTPDTHFIVDWHPDHKNVLFAGGCSGHLFKHGPVFGEFVAGVGLRDYGTADRFKIAGRKKLMPSESPTGR